MTNPSLDKIAEMIQAALAEHLGKPTAAKPATAEGKADRQQELETAVIRAFKRAGFTDNLKPRESIQTYNRWLAQGFKVKPGEKSIKVKQFRLFHVTQVEPIEQPAAEPKGNAGKSTLTLFPKEKQAKPAAEDQPTPPTAAA